MTGLRPVVHDSGDFIGQAGRIRLPGSMPNEIGEDLRNLQNDNLSFVICNLSFCYLLFGPDLSSISRRIF
jgi:hypothetical protein